MEFSTNISIILAVGAVLMGTSSGLMCYDCVSGKNDLCGLDTLSVTPATELEKINTKDCGDLPFCAKFKYSDDSVARLCSGNHSIIWDGADLSDTCFSNPPNKAAFVACYCSSDYCNEAGSLKLTPAITITPAIGILSYFLNT